MKILRTIQLDLSDNNVFTIAAKSGEIAIPGSFVFSDKNYTDLSQKDKLAFQSGWLGLDSFGYSTLVQIGQATTDEMEGAVKNLASYFVREHGAPSIADALPVAQEELNYAVSLCEFDAGKVLAIEREEGAEGIKERIHLIDPTSSGDHSGLKIWSIVDD